MYQRRWAEAAIQYDAALANDPLRPITHLSRALSFWFQGKPEASLPDFDESLRLAPGFHYSTMEKTKVLAQLRRFDEAAAAARTLPAGESEVMLSFIAALQDPSKQEAAIRQIVAHGPGGVIGRPILFALLGRNDLTLAELERLFAEKDPYRVFVYMIPMFDPLRADPRFQALVHQVKLPPPTQGKAESP
jgi:tetratricopeptide (TPR) repeat protein